MQCIEIIKRVLWEGEIREIGDVLEVENNDAFMLVEYGKAKIYKPKSDKMMTPERKKGYRIK